MENTDKRSRKDELDDFWDFRDLVPERKKISRPAQKPVTVDVVDTSISFSEDSFEEQRISADASTLIKRYVIDDAPSVREAAPESEYEPENSLIHKVKVYTHKSTYDYYERFRETAEKLYHIEGKECPKVPYFSYVPQYNQMSREQLEFYFWWRSCARDGRYIDTEYSYILLYAFEIINVCSEHGAEFLRDQLFSLWLAYREDYPRLDKLLPEWVVDLCLINGIGAPKGRFPLGAISNNCGTAEFYVSAVSGNSDKYINSILTWCCSYDYKKSRYYQGENAPLYDKYVPQVLKEALLYSSGADEHKLMGGFGYSDSKATREAYVGALCSYRRKKRIEIEFCSFSRSHELRYLVGDIVKCIENKLRAYLGIKSRLTVYSLSLELSSFINGYMENILPPKKKARQIKDVSEFEKKYELPQKELSISDAMKIEDASWETTRALVEAFSDTDAQEDIPTPVENFEESISSDDYSLRGRLGELYDYLLALYRKDREACDSFVKKSGAIEETIVDRINEICTDHMGDIIIDGESGGWYVIEDYADMIQTD